MAAGGAASVGILALWTIVLSAGSGLTLALSARLAIGRAPRDAVALAAPAPAITMLLGRTVELPPSIVPLLAIGADFVVVSIAFSLQKRAATVVVLLHALVGGLLLILVESVVSIP
jgi:hypothetical protein